MDLLAKLQEDMKTALKAGQKDRLQVIRMLISDVKVVDMAAKPTTPLQAVEAYHKKLKMSVEEAHAEVNRGWAQSYSPEAIAQAVGSFNHKPLAYRINILVARLCFRGIYFPQMGRLAWVKVIGENAQTICDIVKEGFRDWLGGMCKRPARSATVGTAGD